MNFLAAFIPAEAVSREWLVKAYKKTLQAVSLRGGRGAQLRLAAGELKAISVNSEDEFLAIGDRLMDFQQRAMAVCAVVNGMLDQLRYGKGATARADLASFLNILQRNAITPRQGDGVSHALRELMERLDQVAAPFTGFGQMNRQLKLLGTYTKIECANMGDRARNFAPLAEHVASLSNEVSCKAEAVLGRRDAVALTLQNALATATAMADASRQTVDGVLEKTRQNQQALTDMAMHSATSAGVIASTADEVAASLGEVVVSLQTHDMVRQQVQHVAEALDELAGRWAKPAVGPGAWFVPEQALFLETGKLCEIQAAQLNHSTTALMEAVEQIIAALQEVVEQETRMAVETADLLGTADVAGTSMFAEMGRDLHEAIGVLIATAAAKRQLAESLVSVAVAVDEIVQFAASIDSIAYDIKLIALNAQIHAASMGSKGNSLGVLAGAIQQLSVAARDQADGVSLMLGDIKAMTEAMQEKARREAAMMETKFEEMRRILEEVLEALCSMNDGITAGLSSASGMVRALAADIEAACGSITIHHRLAGVLDKVVAGLDGITQEMMALVPAGEWAAASLSSPDCRYTMHSERDIHALIARRQGASDSMADGPPPVDTEAGAPAEGQELGDNVELF